MSGAFGWHQNHHTHTPTRVDRSAFTDAVRAYNGAPAAPVPQVPTSPPPRQSFQAAKQQTVAQPVPTARHALKASAQNVLIVVTDVTGSMGENPSQIFQRLPLMYEEAATMLGSRDLEMLFVAHGDARTDRHAIQVARFGRGPELDQMLTTFSLSCGGGGQGSETPELVAYYLLKQVDVSCAQNIYVWFITDEAGCERMSATQVDQWLGLTLDPEFSDAQAVFGALRRKMQTFVILMETGAYAYNPTLRDAIRPYWERMIGPEGIVPLTDTRRIVDTMLGTIAVMTGQLARFTDALKSRQLPTKYGTQNVQTVLKSIALVGRGTPSAPHILKARTRPLLPGPTAGTRSLLHPDSDA